MLKPELEQKDLQQNKNVIDATEVFNKEIDKIKLGEYRRARQITVVKVPAKCWLEAGLKNEKIVMSVAVFYKVTKEKHNVDENVIRALPNLIQDPLYIFKSSTDSASFVGVLKAIEKSENGEKPLIAVIKPVSGKAELNVLTSVYGKDTDFVNRETAKGNLLYKK